MLSEDVVQPDLMFIANERIEIIKDEAIKGAPDLIIEILSSSTAERDRTYKKRLYARHGVCEYWLVDPEAATIEVFQLGEKGYVRLGRESQRLSTPLLAGLDLALNDVF